MFYAEKAPSAATLTDVDMEKINRFTRRKMEPTEIYDFSIILCDNDIDRDYERFSIDALYCLKELFIGKTGIFDHNPKGTNQTARIFDTEVLQDASRTNQSGEMYSYLKARAYMVRSSKNEDLILEIDGGIKKEVSVGCSVAKKECSICGADLKASSCGHVPGETYQGKICCGILSEPEDAYEWSFVAVPAQKEAGVIKKFSAADEDDSTLPSQDGKKLIKGIFEHGGNRLLTDDEVNSLKAYVGKVEQLAKTGRAYIQDLKKDVLKLSYLVNDSVESTIMEQVVEKMTLSELKAFKKAYEIKLDGSDGGAVQLMKTPYCPTRTENNEFKI